MNQANGRKLLYKGHVLKKRYLLLSTFLDQSSFQDLAYMNILPTHYEGQKIYVARTGYTGEHGYEVYLPNQLASAFWQQILEAAKKTQLRVEACGLGARDTLRLEACYLLYGNDMNDEVSPLEAGIKWAVKMQGPDFVGKASLVAQEQSGVMRKIFAFKMQEDGIPRHGMDVYHQGELVGHVTSGSVLPTVGGAGGMALLKPNDIAIGSTIELDIRGKRKLAKIEKRPLYMAKAAAK
jgi:aminomethyltransferase